MVAILGQSKNQTAPSGKPSDRTTTQPQNLQRGSNSGISSFPIDQGPAGQTNTANTKNATAGKDSYDKLTAWSAAAAATFTLGLLIVGWRGVNRRD